mgnify:CR=1 FL=1
MTAYVIANVEVTDKDAYAAYISLASASVAAFGGQYIARGGEVTVLEGNKNWHRVVILAFPSLARAQEWYASPDYAAARAIRQRAARSEIVFLPGMPGATGAAGAAG